MNREEELEMSPEMAKIFENFRPGIDFFVLNENEPYQGVDEYGRPDGKIGHYKLDIDEMLEGRGNQKFMWARNCGVSVALDAVKKILICTARPDVIPNHHSDEAGLFVPFRRDLGVIPVDPGKLAAFRYQERVDDMLDAEKEAIKANSSTKSMVDILSARRRTGKVDR